MHHGKFGTSINYMDCGMQLPVTNWLKQKFELDYVDIITEPGPDKLLAGSSKRQIDSIKGRVLISVNAHGSDTILFAGHFDCAGNSVSREEHFQQIKKRVETVSSWKLPVKKLAGRMD